MLLERLLDSLAVHVEPFALCRIPAGTSLRLDARDDITLHFVLEGDGEVVWGPTRARAVRQGHLVVMPAQLTHAIRRASGVADRKVRDISAVGEVDAMQVFTGGDNGQDEDNALVVACGRLQASYAHGPGLFDLLADPLVTDFSRQDEMAHIFARLLAESRAPAPGSRMLLASLMNECLVLLLRRLSTGDTCALPWLEALDEPRMARALEIMLERPENAHSLESLAAQISMSRSAFAREFKTSFGRTPMELLRDIRLRRAAELLHSTTLPIDTIGRRVGFASRSHFSHAFRDHFGTTPTDFRSSRTA
ncbi:helix-turn-helix domain-containing protein [Streptomyces sp. NPDC048142]|uniref:AraC family transcriptional regulator n=1 Tax=Streptomyces sp. NPDC048142 TaxID=3365501 RepID=UPI003721D84B